MMAVSQLSSQVDFKSHMMVIRMCAAVGPRALYLVRFLNQSHFIS